MNGTPESRRRALQVVVIIAFVLAAYVASPIWAGLMFGAVLAFTVQPVYERLLRGLGGRGALAATIVTLASGLLSIALGVLAVYVVTDEVLTLVRLIQRHVEGASLADVIGPRATHLAERLGFSQGEILARLRQQMDSVAAALASVAGIAMTTVSNALLGLLIALMTEYYVLRQWSQMTRRLETLLPLEPRHTRALMAELRDVGRGALLGTLATGIAQGVLAGIGLAIARVPQPLTWATLTVIASFVPFVGTAAVWLPAGVYLVYTGHVAWGIFIFVWGAAVVMAFADYVLRPRFVGKNRHDHTLMLLVALLGGLECMGLAGLIVGPIFMSLFVAVLRIYERESPPAPP